MQTEHQRMLVDIRTYGNQEHGTHRNIEWSMNRPYGTYWCGYIHYTGDLTDAQIEQLENRNHGGLTGGLGFDCAHYGDYFPFTLEQSSFLMKGTFKDHDYVLNIIQNMIDYIIDG